MTQQNRKFDSGGSPERGRDGVSFLEQSGDGDCDGGGVAALRKGPWTKEEDEILLRYVKEKGIVKWTSIGKDTGLARSGKSCRLRWLNHLRPNLKKGSFSKEEENLIVQMHSKYGNKWTLIAAKLPGRTDNEIKNFWNTRVKKCLKQKLPIYPKVVVEDQSSIGYTNNDSTFPNPIFHENNDNNLTISDHIFPPTQTHLSSLHQVSFISPHTSSLEQLQCPANLLTQSTYSFSNFPSTKHPLLWPPPEGPSPYQFSSQKQSNPTNSLTQSFLQQVCPTQSYLSTPLLPKPQYQSIQTLHSSLAMQPKSWLSSSLKDNISSLGQQSSINHSSNPLIKPSFSASSPFYSTCISSTSAGQFSCFRKTGGKLPRPLSTPQFPSTLGHCLPNNQMQSHFTHESNLPKQSSTNSLPDMNLVFQTSTVPTFKLDSLAAKSPISSLRVGSSSLETSWPSSSQLYNPVSQHSFTLKSEPPSIQSFSIAALEQTSDTNASQHNVLDLNSLEFLDAPLQEALAVGSCKHISKEDSSAQSLTGESLLNECMKSEDLLDDILRKKRWSCGISWTGHSLDENSRKESLLTESFKTIDSSANCLNVENSSCKSRKRKNFTNISSEREDLYSKTPRKDKLLYEISTGYAQEENLMNDISISENLKGVLVDRSSEDSLTKRLKMVNAVPTEGLGTQELLVEDSRTEALLNTKLGNALSSEGSNVTTCFKMEDIFLGESSTVEDSPSKNFGKESSLEQKVSEGMLEEGSRREDLSTESLKKEDCVFSENSCYGDSWRNILNKDNLMGESLSQDFHFLIEDTQRDPLFPSEQKSVPDESGTIFSQPTTCSQIQSGYLGGESSYIEPSAEGRKRVEVEDNVNMADEISGLLEYFATTAEIPE